MTKSFKKLLGDPNFNEHVPWKTIRFKPQEVIIEEGGKSRYVYMILRGTVHVSTHILLDHQDKQKVGIAKLSQDEIFGELSMFDDMPHNASVTAASSCKIAVIDSQALSSFLEQHTEYGYHIMRDIVGLLVKRMRESNVRSSSILSWYLRETPEEIVD